MSFSTNVPWDEGVRWHLQQAFGDGPDYDDDPLSVDFILEHHLRSAHPEAEAAYVDHLRKVSLEEAERATGRSFLPQWWTLVLDVFPPSGVIELPRPPLIDVQSITYEDESGVDQVLSGSPLQFRVDHPSGPTATRAQLRPLSGSSWPSGSGAGGSVRVRFHTGYPGTPPAIPYEIQQGRLIAISEMHKQRSESVHISQSGAMRQARRFWAAYKVYGY
jgi:uncharacterized phiE125 gp8 family phage protein